MCGPVQVLLSMRNLQTVLRGPPNPSNLSDAAVHCSLVEGLPVQCSQSTDRQKCPPQPLPISVCNTATPRDVARAQMDRPCLSPCHGLPQNPIPGAPQICPGQPRIVLVKPSWVPQLPQLALPVTPADERASWAHLLPKAWGGCGMGLRPHEGRTDAPVTQQQP